MPSRGYEEGSDEDTDRVGTDRQSADKQFVDDLTAANRCKAFLLGGGVEISKDTLREIAHLCSIFQDDIDEFERYYEVYERAYNRQPLRFRLLRRFRR